MSSKDTTRAGALAVAVTAFLWSTAGLFIMLVPWHPVLIAGARSLVASVVILLWLRRPRFHLSLPQLGAALANTATMLLFVTANKTTTPTNAILLQYIAPVLTALFGAWLLKERAYLEHWVGFAFVAVGMLVLFFDKLGGGAMLGNLLSVASALTFSLTFIFMRMQREGSPVESMLLSHWAAVLVALVAMPFLPPPTLTANAVFGVLALGIFQIGIAAVLFSYGIKRCSAVSANLIAVIEPVSPPVWSFLAMGVAPSGNAIIGGAIIIAAVTSVSVISGRRGTAGAGVAEASAPQPSSP